MKSSQVNDSTCGLLAPDGGLSYLDQFLGHNNGEVLPPLDVVFVSLDLEVSRSERNKSRNNKAYRPFVRELGIASLDTRDIFTDEKIPSELGSQPLIRTRQWSTFNASKDFEKCDVTDFRECVFAETFQLGQDQVAPSFASCVQIKDSRPAKPHDLRNIILVGHSVKGDIDIIERLGLDIQATAPITAVIDTHLLSRAILGSSARGFSLSAVLNELKCPFNPWELHDAGTYATYTLYVMIMLAIRRTETLNIPSSISANAQHLRAVARAEMSEGHSRWKPVSGVRNCDDFNGSASNGVSSVYNDRSNTKVEAISALNRTQHKELKEVEDCDQSETSDSDGGVSLFPDPAIAPTCKPLP